MDHVTGLSDPPNKQQLHSRLTFLHQQSVRRTPLPSRDRDILTPFLQEFDFDERWLLSQSLRAFGLRRISSWVCAEVGTEWPSSAIPSAKIWSNGPSCTTSDAWHEWLSFICCAVPSDTWTQLWVILHIIRYLAGIAIISMLHNIHSLAISRMLRRRIRT